MLAYCKSFIKHNIKWRFNSKNWILGRHACLGLDVLNLMGHIPPVFNIQKGRVDYLLDVLDNPDKRARSLQVEPFMDRKDIVPLITQEEYFLLRPANAPTLVYMDSYSELTDQLFVHKKNQWRFCCNYTDLTHSNKFSQRFEAVGLLPLEELEENYHRFFRYIRNTYDGVPILFLHFPIKLDSREKFKLRHERILALITKLAEEYAPFYSIAIDESIVGWPAEKIPGLENFPYHYNQATYDAFADEVRKTGVFDKIRVTR
jgi:hypothetical protein